MIQKPQSLAPSSQALVACLFTLLFLTQAVRSEDDYAQSSGGRFGAYALHLESGQSIGRLADESFPLASVVKLPIAIALLKRCDAGEYNLDSKVHLGQKDVHPLGHSPLTEYFPDKGIDISYRELLRYDICESDTTAGDVLLDKGGGPAAVQALMDATGARGIKVKESETILSLKYSGVDTTSVDLSNAGKLEKLSAKVSPSAKQAAAEDFLKNPENTATPRAMVTLLCQLQSGKILKRNTTELLLKLLEETQTWPNRIRGKLPKDTLVAHKTGTWGTTNGINAATNDVGIITLPDNKGHICLAIFISASTRPQPEREFAIASFAREVYDRWRRHSLDGVSRH